MQNQSVGSEGSTGIGPFNPKPKVRAEKEEMFEDGRRESILPERTAEDDLLLGKLKSQDMKVPRHPRQSP